MFNWLTKLFKPKPGTMPPLNTASRPDGFQPASLLDAQFIFDSILAEASCGHFSSDYLLPISHGGLVHQIQSSITQHICPTHRNSLSKSAIYIFLDSNCPAGFSWVVETEKCGEKELYLLAVLPNHRKKGIGKILIAETISQYPSKTKFIARLYQTSQSMLRMLVAMGFKRIPNRCKSTVCLSYVSS